jgi:hypothetical protein
MAASGALPKMPDFATDTGNDPFSSVHLSSLNFSTVGDMKTHLHRLLDSKEKQLQQAGSLGQRVLSQQMELEERIRQIQEVIEEGKGEEEDEQRLDEETRERYRLLADTLLAWDEENARLSSAFGAGAKVCLLPFRLLVMSCRGAVLIPLFCFSIAFSEWHVPLTRSTRLRPPPRTRTRTH